MNALLFLRASVNNCPYVQCHTPVNVLINTSKGQKNSCHQLQKVPVPQFQHNRYLALTDTVPPKQSCISHFVTITSCSWYSRNQYFWLHLEFVVNEVTLGRDFLRVLRFSPVTTVPSAAVTDAVCVEMPQTVFHNSPRHVSCCCCCCIVLSRAAVVEQVIKHVMQHQVFVVMCLYVGWQVVYNSCTVVIVNPAILKCLIW
jgi:hypothetical protein